MFCQIYHASWNVFHYKWKLKENKTINQNEIHFYLQLIPYSYDYHEEWS